MSSVPYPPLLVVLLVSVFSTSFVFLTPHTHTHVRTCIRVHTITYSHAHTHVHLWTHVCACTHICIHTDTHRDLHTDVCTYTFTQHTHVHTRTLGLDRIRVDFPTKCLCEFVYTGAGGSVTTHPTTGHRRTTLC